MHWGYGAGAWWWVFMLFGMVAFWVAIITLVVAVVRRLWSPGPDRDAQPGSDPTAEEILAERLARGEIDADEYQRRLDALRSASRA